MAFLKNNDLYKDGELYEGKFLEWNQNQVYKIGQFSFYAGKIYVSTENNNTGNIPGAGPAWREYNINDLNDNLKDYELSISATTVTTLEHGEDTQELILYSKNYQHELILPDTIILNNSTLTVEVGESYNFLNNNILPIKENDILYNQSTINGSFVVTHNLDLENYFVIAKDNSKVQGQLLLVDILEQTYNSCVISTNEAYQDINMYFLSEKSFNKTRKITESLITGFSSVTHHNMGNSDVFVWAVDENNNKKVTLPSVTNLGERYATLEFQDISANYTVYFGGTTRESINYVNDTSKTAILLDDGVSEWRMSVDTGGNINFSVF